MRKVGAPPRGVIASPALAKESATIPKPGRDEQPSAGERGRSVSKSDARNKPEEAKVLAGRPDANMPALLCRVGDLAHGGHGNNPTRRPGHPLQRDAHTPPGPRCRAGYRLRNSLSTVSSTP